MPIYEYLCRHCGQQVELMQKISEPPAKKCPECGRSALTKQVSAAGFRLTGAGWYETDFKSGNKKNLASATEAATPSDAAKPGTGVAADTTAAAPKPAAVKTEGKTESKKKPDKKGGKPAAAA